MQAITKAGGFRAVAKRLGWASASEPLHSRGLAAVAAEIRKHMQDHGLAGVPSFKVGVHMLFFTPND